MASLLVLAPKPDAQRVIPLCAAEVVFGRDAVGLAYNHPDAQVVHLPFTTIGRFHATLRREETLFTINDAGRRGTGVNGKGIRETVLLRDGDEIRMGEFLFVFRDETGWEAFTVHGLDKVMLCTLLSLLTCGCPQAQWNHFLRLIGVLHRPAAGSRFLLVVRPEQVSVLAAVAQMSEAERGELAAQWGGTEDMRGSRQGELSALLGALGGLAESASSQQRHLLLWQNPGESA